MNLAELFIPLQKRAFETIFLSLCLNDINVLFCFYCVACGPRGDSCQWRKSVSPSWRWVSPHSTWIIWNKWIYSLS